MLCMYTYVEVNRPDTRTIGQRRANHNSRSCLANRPLYLRGHLSISRSADGYIFRNGHRRNRNFKQSSTYVCLLSCTYSVATVLRKYSLTVVAAAAWGPDDYVLE